MLRWLWCAFRGHPPDGPYHYYPAAWFKACSCGEILWTEDAIIEWRQKQ